MAGTTLVLLALLGAPPTTEVKGAPSGEFSTRLDSLIEAERAFAAKSQSDGTRTAFLTFLAEGSIVFEPGPVDGLEHWRARGDSPDLLTWSPAYADVSWAGDLGYTTGPWEYKKDRADTQAVASGQFLSIWNRQPEGAWKVVLDIGTSNPPPAEDRPSSTTRPTRPAGREAQPRGKAESAYDTVLARERSFAEVFRKEGAAAAYRRFADPAIRLLREGKFPIVGLDRATAEPSAGKGALVYSPGLGRAAISGDLAYIYGDYRVEVLGPSGSATAAEPAGCFVRLWKTDRSGHFHIVAEVLHPLPPP